MENDMSTHQVKTKDNIRFEDPLVRIITLRVTEKEYSQLDAVSRENYISISELIRNLNRDYIHNYCISENLRKKLHISNEIDRFVLEKRLISVRNDTNLSKIREILLDFEAFLDEHCKHMDYDELEIRKAEILGMLELVYNNDVFLSRQIESQVKRLFKNKYLKTVKCEKL